jgi:MFS family permease
MLQSAGSSGTIALRNAVVASILTPAERGSYLGYINGCMLFAPALGPVIGGGVIATLGWRAIFWGLAIITSAQTIVYAMFVPETNRKIVGNGSIAPRTWWSKSIWQLLRGSKKSSYATSDKILPARKMNWPNPIKSLLVYREPDIAILMLFSSIRFSGIYVLMASLPFLMTTKYHLSVVQVSLCYM